MMNPYIAAGLPKQDLKEYQRIQISPTDFIKKVAHEYDVYWLDLVGPDTKRILSEPRQIAMYLIRKHTKLTIVEIGYIFNRHYTTVLYSWTTVHDLMKFNTVYRDRVENIEYLLYGAK